MCWWNSQNTTSILRKKYLAKWGALHSPPPDKPLKKKSTRSRFRIITDKDWALVRPFLHKKVKKKRKRLRPILNSIFLMLIDGVSSRDLPIHPDFGKKTATLNTLYLWKKSGTLKKILTRLAKGTQGVVQLKYQRLLRDFEKASPLQKAPLIAPMSQLTIERRPTIEKSDQEVALSSLNQPPLSNNRQEIDFSSPLSCSIKSNLDQSSPLYELLKSRETGPRFRRLTDKEWALVHPLLTKGIKSIQAKPRAVLNSVLLMLIDGVRFQDLPKNPDFARRSSTQRFLYCWKRDGTLEKILIRLVEGTQGRVQSEYQELLRDVQGTLAFRRADNKKMLINDREWDLLESVVFRQPRYVRCSKRDKTDFRLTLNSIFWSLLGGFSWNQIPSENPYFFTNVVAFHWFSKWKKDGTLEKMLTALTEKLPERADMDYRRLLRRAKKGFFFKF